ncbi:MAG: helix-turn-helix domain-containing protein [Desulfovibrionaceae bacterium]|nr:helix-turn-helix domain-containing protein [Desulfovibrionaceae bacterium]
MFEASFRKRLIELRMKKDVSARDMSLSMGQSEGYINKIESGHSLPSLTGFFYICDYFRISPKEFFDDGLCYPPLLTELTNHLKALNHKQIENILSIVKDMKN